MSARELTSPRGRPFTLRMFSDPETFEEGYELYIPGPHGPQRIAVYRNVIDFGVVIDDAGFQVDQHYKRGEGGKPDDTDSDLVVALRKASNAILDNTIMACRGCGGTYLYKNRADHDACKKGGKA